MSAAWRDIGDALGWGFRAGLSVAVVFLTIDAIRHGASAGAADGIDFLSLLPATGIAFVVGFVAGILFHAYLRGLEKKAK